ncbi:MAG: YkgJ family cysteine cluster protein [Pseudomonadota bacterium]
MRAVLHGEQIADVPCDGCVGCCVSSYAIPLRPTDKTALAAVPDRYLHLPVDGGFALMRHRDDGTCPMLEARRCTIYADRPQTCRDYDCRIYAATGLLPDGERPVIRDRVLEWRFAFTTSQDLAQREALSRAVHFIQQHAALFPSNVRAGSAAAAAVLAVKVWPLFADKTATNEKGDEPGSPSPLEQVQRVLEAARAFDTP